MVCKYAEHNEHIHALCQGDNPTSSGCVFSYTRKKPINWASVCSPAGRRAPALPPHPHLHSSLCPSCAVWMSYTGCCLCELSSGLMGQTWQTFPLRLQARMLCVWTPRSSVSPYSFLGRLKRMASDLNLSRVPAQQG